MKNYLKLFKELNGEGTVWEIAIRKRNGKCLYEGNYSSFSVIKNSFRYWRADPFLFEHNGETYLFAELFDRIQGKGVIGVAKIKNGKCGKFRACLDLPYHLSYPCVFTYNGDIYMVPECARSGKITVFISKKFPYEWKEHNVLFEGEGVDTTPLPINQNKQLSFISTLRTEINRDNNCLFALDYSGNKRKLIDNDYTLRPAGHFIWHGNGFLRPSQDCNDSYGGALVFKRVNDSDMDNYKEETILRITPNEIDVDYKGKRYNGIHTYNSTKEYEVIDLSYNVGKSLSFMIKKLRKHFIKEK